MADLAKICPRGGLVGRVRKVPPREPERSTAPRRVPMCSRPCHGVSPGAQNRQQRARLLFHRLPRPRRLLQRRHVGGSSRTRTRPRSVHDIHRGTFRVNAHTNHTDTRSIQRRWIACSQYPPCRCGACERGVRCHGRGGRGEAHCQVGPRALQPRVAQRIRRASPRRRHCWPGLLLDYYL
jgi:hypothetical protein